MTLQTTFMMMFTILLILALLLGVVVLMSVDLFVENGTPFTRESIDTITTIYSHQHHLRSSASFNDIRIFPEPSRVQIQRPQKLLTESYRNLQAISSTATHIEDVIRDFVPLSCNDNIETVTCQSWSTIFGTTTKYFNKRIVIPCGQCIIMDYPTTTIENVTTTGTTYTFANGIDIIGKFVIPDTPQNKIHIYTSAIIVQGIFEMTSITTPISNQPNIEITLINLPITTTVTNGTSITEAPSSFFTPVSSNTNACISVNNTCNIGKKGIVVAGGTVNFRGIPPDTPTWVHMYDVAFWGNDTIFLPKSIYGKWNVGAEIVIASHTNEWDASQVRTITSITTFFSPNPDYVTVRLNETIIRPTTLKESKTFAVEVALLSRNIVLIGDPDSINPKHGGHIMVTYTPNVQQRIEGIEIRNFGQQGNLGRYPIHFHFCNNVTGSVVSKNTIRQSNQRCVVVHGTNKLRVEHNVAYDTKGHCYMTEDGIETGNEFLYNIGVLTGIPDTIIPDLGPNGVETDGSPSTFWITNPTNIFIGNVAAGSQHSAFWFEPKLRGVRAYLYPDYNPMYEPLTMFKDNVAHSNNGGGTGAIRLYTTGYRPRTLAILDGLKVYRNFGVGIFIHRNHNILVANSIFADNHVSIDIDRAEGIEISNTTIIGESESYRKLKNRQIVPSICGRRGNNIGLELHTWKHNLYLEGAAISNVTFYDFDSRSGCKNSSSIAFDKQTLKGGNFEFYASFRGIRFYKTFFGLPLIRLADGLNSINMCIVNDIEYDLVYLTDLDGSFRPNISITPTMSSLVASDNRMHMTFLDSSACVDNTLGCYSYCQNTCFRSMRYYVEGPGQAEYKLKVCSRSDHSKCSFFKGGRRGDSGPHAYIAHIPDGQKYDAVFVDSAGGEISPPEVTEVVEQSFCSGSGFNFTLFNQLP